ncbi:MAG: uroporphyrinogen-III synthase [Nitrospirota bacterium]|nr:uroporphyrinogen-III synthase [Nitrospirota bacterium]
MTPLSETNEPLGFAGMTVAAFESRMADQMANLITRYGGIAAVAPSMQEIPLENNSDALDFGHRLLSGNIDLLILLTGVGARTLVDIWKIRFSLADIKQALTQTTVLVRGPKPLAALKELGLKPDLTVPEPNTWEDILYTLDEFKPEGLSGFTIGIQEYGTTNEELMKALTNRGAIAIGIPVYRWALPDNIEPLQHVLDAITSQSIDVVLFTSAAQVTHIVKLLHKTQNLERFRQALNRIVVGSIGTMTSQQLRAHQLPVDLEPSHSKMGILVKETSLKAQAIVQRKRQPPAQLSGFLV